MMNCLSLDQRIKYCEKQIKDSNEKWVKKEYEGVIKDHKNRIDEINSILEKIKKMTIK